MKINPLNYFILLLIVLPILASAQSLEVKRLELQGGNVIIYYALLDTIPGRTYTVNAYASRDNYINPLVQLTGDHGLQVKPGKEHKLTWNAKQELGETYQGQVSIDLRARAYVPFILFDNFSAIKRGKHKEVTWRGGTPQNILNFELYNKKGEKVAVIPNVPNAGHTSLLIPNDVKTGKGYTFKIVDSKNKDQVVITESFAIKRKVPIPLVVAGLAAIGGGVALLGSGGGDNGPPSVPAIVDPTNPPGN